MLGVCTSLMELSRNGLFMKGGLFGCVCPTIHYIAIFSGCRIAASSPYYVKHTLPES